MTDEPPELSFPRQSFEELKSFQGFISAAVLQAVCKLKPLISGEKYSDLMDSALNALLGSQIIQSKLSYDLLQNEYPHVVQCLLMAVKEKASVLNIHPPPSLKWEHILMRCLKRINNNVEITSKVWWEAAHDIDERHFLDEEVSKHDDEGSPDHKRSKKDTDDYPLKEQSKKDKEAPSSSFEHLTAAAYCSSSLTHPPNGAGSSTTATITVEAAVVAHDDGGGSQEEKAENEESNDDKVENDEGGHIHFAPVIPLPKMVQVVTGEESEEVLYNHRAKLFHWAGGEWKERGLGDIKILKDRESGNLRLLMLRQEQVLRICLNHRLSPEINFVPKGENNRSFQWWALTPTADGEMIPEHFAVLFKTEEIAKDFLNAALLAQCSLDEDVKLIAVLEPQVSAEELAMALELQLPCNFYTYKLRPDCKGCVGCADKDEDVVNNTTIASLGAQNNGNTEIVAGAIAIYSRSGASTPVSISSGSNLADCNKAVNETSDNEEGNERHEPHFDPALALPDLITLRTGEEDEELVFRKRAMLYRYDGQKAEWKERGVGDLKLLLHHATGRYRLLLRREQVHKTVLNHLLTQDLDLQPLNNSSKNGLCWGALNFAEDKARFEKLAVTFQDEDTLSEFNLKVAEAKEQLTAQAMALANHSKVML